MTTAMDLATALGLPTPMQSKNAFTPPGVTPTHSPASWADGLPAPTEKQAAEFVKTWEKLKHYSRENELWTEAMVILLQGVGQGEANVGYEDSFEQFDDMEIDTLQDLVNAFHGGPAKVQQKVKQDKVYDSSEDDFLSHLSHIATRALPHWALRCQSLTGSNSGESNCGSQANSEASLSAWDAQHQCNQLAESQALTTSAVQACFQQCLLSSPADHSPRSSNECFRQPLPPGPVPRRKSIGSSSSRPFADAASDGSITPPLPTLPIPGEAECTLVVRGIPARYLQTDILELWKPQEQGFDFLFLPYSKKQHRSVTYCFLNFASYEAASAFQSSWSNATLPTKDVGINNVIPLSISLAQVQGLKQNMLHIVNDSKFNTLRFPPVVFDKYGNPQDFLATLNSMRRSEAH